MFKKLMKFSRIISTHPILFLKGLQFNNEYYYQDYVKRRFGMNNGLPTIDLLDLFPDIDEFIDPYCYLDWSSLPTDLLLLKCFAKKIENCNYLEIGTWRGESISNVASVAKKCTSVSLSDKEMRSMGFSDKYLKTARIFSKGKENIIHIYHNSQTFDFTKLKDKYDLIFIDGDHSYKAVRNDTENTFKYLRKKDTIVVWHDYGKSTEKIDWEILAAILDGVPRKLHKHLYHVSNTLSAVFIKEDYKTKYLSFPQKPDKIFKINITGRKIK